MAKFPLRFTLETNDGGEYVPSSFGDLRWVPGPRHTVKVFGYEVIRSEEGGMDENVYLLFEDLRIYAPPETFDYRNNVWTPDGEQWMMNGYAEDNRNNPYFDPGLVTYHAAKSGSVIGDRV